MQLIVVLLPAPFGPSSPKHSPREIFSETPSTAVNAPVGPLRYCLTRFSTASGAAVSVCMVRVRYARTLVFGRVSADSFNTYAHSLTCSSTSARRCSRSVDLRLRDHAEHARQPFR